MKRISNYYFPILLIFSMMIGGIIGYFMGGKAVAFKPLGDIFLNLILTTLVPLIFFNISSSIARMGESRELWKMIYTMMAVFIFTGIVAAIYMLFIVKMFPPVHSVFNHLDYSNKDNKVQIMGQLANMISASDFSKLLSHQNMLALIIFSFLVGLATSLTGENGKSFSQFLQSGSDVFMKMISLIMYFAPIGFCAYFAVIVGELGPKIIENYFQVTCIYYGAGLIYFLLAYTFYAYLSGSHNIKIFWKNSLIPLLTSLATCSSAASLPANLQAVKKMNVPPSVSDTVIPIGTILHKDGSVLGAIIKIAFLFGVFQLSFSGFHVLFVALLIALLVGTVMGAIPSGGMLGEMLIITLYGFPPHALLIIAAITIIIDPLATMLNVIGNTVSSLMVARLVNNANLNMLPNVCLSPLVSGVKEP